jgi:hypothetical protein
MRWHGRKGEQSHAPCSQFTHTNFNMPELLLPKGKGLLSLCLVGVQNQPTKYTSSLPKFGHTYVTLLTLPHSSCQHLTKIFGYLNLVQFISVSLTIFGYLNSS